MILGVTDSLPRHVVGSQAFLNLGERKRQLTEMLRLRVEAVEINHPDGRVVVFKVPSRPPGRPIQVDGAYWMRSHESLVPMTPDQLKFILDEGETDVTNEICHGATIQELDSAALSLFRTGVIDRATSQLQKDRYAAMPIERLLMDTGLICDNNLTKASILLLGSESAIRRWVPNAEVIIEYRQVHNRIRYDRRENMRQAILLELERLWEFILPYDLPIRDFQKGTGVNSLLRFPERSVREAILNAVVHRDYKHPESVRIRISPERLEVVSPGTFPGMITSATIADEQLRRNRLLAEALEKCGRIERSGQGVDLMIAAAVRQAQKLPTFTERDQNDVQVMLFAPADETFLDAMQAVPNDAWDYLTVDAMRTLDSFRQQRAIDDSVPASSFSHSGVQELVEQEILVVTSEGHLEANPLLKARGRRTIKPNSSKASPVADRAQRKQQLFNQIRINQGIGSRLVDLHQTMSDLTASQLQVLLKELKAEGMIRLEGRTRAGRWFPNGVQLQLTLV